jgi:hypothetical protein
LNLAFRWSLPGRGYVGQFSSDLRTDVDQKSCARLRC